MQCLLSLLLSRTMQLLGSRILCHPLLCEAGDQRARRSQGANFFAHVSSRVLSHPRFGLAYSSSQAVAGMEWWLPVEGAYWRRPEGPKTDVFRDGRGNHPATHVRTIGVASLLTAQEENQSTAIK